jgi:GMP synthase-like glutamine amidotransferase
MSDSDRVLVLRHHDEDHPGLIGEAFVARGFALDVVMMNESTPTPSLDGVAILLILGSSNAVYDHEVERAWFGRELELIADAGKRGVPVFGICFGAQALCLFHGGRVSRAPEAEIGWYEITPENGHAIEAGPWFEFHYDRCTLPASAELWASSARAVQAFSVGRNLGVQFHPEIDDGQLRDWLESAADSARDFGHDIDELLAATVREVPAARERAATLVDLFLRHCGLAPSYGSSVRPG